VRRPQSLRTGPALTLPAAIRAARTPEGMPLIMDRADAPWGAAPGVAAPTAWVSIRGSVGEIRGKQTGQLDSCARTR